MINEEYNIKCPHCNKDLPAEIDFCPYCMERLTPAREVAPAVTHGNKKKIATASVVLFILAIIFTVAGLSLKNNIDKTDNPQNKNFTNTTPISSGFANTKPDETEKPSSQPSSSQATVPNTQTNLPSTENNSSVAQTNIEADIVSRWNNANDDLYIYNFILDDYICKRDKEQLCISQDFHSSGAYIDFTVKNDLQSYTLKIDKITNLNIMYQLCRISFLTIAQENYSDTEFGDFISDKSWEISSPKEEIKTGSFNGYDCRVTLTEITEPGAGSLDYTYYTCLLTIDKSTAD